VSWCEPLDWQPSLGVGCAAVNGGVFYEAPQRAGE
jgi:hypothetical protein